MIFGPLSQSDLNLLIEKLDQFKAHYTITDSKIEIADSLVPLIEEELVKVGAIPPLEEEELEHEEFLCLKCDYISSHAGSCPTHGSALVDYSTWVANQGKHSNDKTIAFAFVIVVAIAIFFALFRG